MSLQGRPDQDANGKSEPQFGAGLLDASIRDARRRLDRIANAAQIEGALMVVCRAVGGVNGLTAEGAQPFRSLFERLPSHVMVAIGRSDASSLKSLIGRALTLAEAFKRVGIAVDGLEELLATATSALDGRRKQATDRTEPDPAFAGAAGEPAAGTSLGWLVRQCGFLAFVIVAPPDPIETLSRRSS